MKKKILCMLFVFIFVLSVFPFSILASETQGSERIDMSKTTIDYDFKFVLGNCDSIDTFKENKLDTNLYFITVAESLNSSNKYDLYIYIYNPSRQSLVRNSEYNVLNISRTTNKEDYTRERLHFVDDYSNTLDSDELTNALILKYRVADMRDNLVDISRVYSIGEFELLNSSNVMPVAYGVGMQYTFTTRQADGLDGKYTYVDCFSKPIGFIEAEAFHTFYRVDTEGVGNYTDIQSVYFPIPNDKLKIGPVATMKVSWEKYSLNNSIATDNTALLSRVESWLGGKSVDLSVVYDILNYDDTPAYKYVYNLEGMQNNKMFDKIYHIGNLYDLIDYFTTFGHHSYKYPKPTFIEDLLSGLVVKPNFYAPEIEINDNPLSLAFWSNKIGTHEEKIIDGEAVIKKLNELKWNESLYNQKVNCEEEFKVTYNSSLDVYKPISGWQKMFYLLATEKATGETVDFNAFSVIDKSDFKNLSPEEISKKYLVDIEDVKCINKNDCKNSCMTCLINDEKYIDCTWHLLRYDTTSFNSYDALILDNENDNFYNACVFNTEVINNFDTISVGFGTLNEQGELVGQVFPFVHSPTQYSSDVYSPPETSSFSTDYGKWDELIKWFNETLIPILKIVLVVIVVLTVLKIVMPLIPKKVIYKNKINKDGKE